MWLCTNSTVCHFLPNVCFEDDRTVCLLLGHARDMWRGFEKRLRAKSERWTMLLLWMFVASRIPATPFSNKTSVAYFWKTGKQKRKVSRWLVCWLCRRVHSLATLSCPRVFWSMVFGTFPALWPVCTIQSPFFLPVAAKVAWWWRTLTGGQCCLLLCGKVSWQ